MFSPVSFDFNVTAEQFSLGDVILHVTGSSKWECGASVFVLVLHEFFVGHDSIMVRLSELVMVKLWKSGSSDWLWWRLWNCPPSRFFSLDGFLC